MLGRSNKIVVCELPDTLDEVLEMGMGLGRVQCSRVLYRDELWLVTTDLPSTVELTDEYIDEVLDLARDGALLQDDVYPILPLHGVWDINIYYGMEML